MIKPNRQGAIKVYIAATGYKKRKNKANSPVRALQEALSPPRSPQVYLSVASFESSSLFSLLAGDRVALKGRLVVQLLGL